MSPLCVTLWYRAPELLFGARYYASPIDMWSVGCVFAELLQGNPLFGARTEQDVLSLIFEAFSDQLTDFQGTLSCLPSYVDVTKLKKPNSRKQILKERFKGRHNDTTLSLLLQLLVVDPEKRLSATEALKHRYFSVLPYSTPPSYLPLVKKF